MNKQLIQFEFEEESLGSIIIEVDHSIIDLDTQGASQTKNFLKEGVSKAQKTFEDAIAGIKPAATKIIKGIASLSPSEIDIEFGIKLNGSIGAIIASSQAESNFKVTLKWKQENISNLKSHEKRASTEQKS